MVKKVLVGFFSLLLFACSSPQLNAEDGKETAEFLHDEMGMEGEIAETTEEYANGIKNVLKLDSDTSVVLKDDDSVEQIHFNNRNAEEVKRVLDVVGIPNDARTVEKALSITPNIRSLENYAHFTTYEGKGLLITIGDPITLEDVEKPYSVMLIFDEERIDDLQEMAEKITE